MYHMLYILYSVCVLATHPTIPTDLKALRGDQFKVRAASTDRLSALPGWTALYFKNQARKSQDLEVRLRCTVVQQTLQKKWEDVLLYQETRLILALFPTIPNDLKVLRGDSSFGERVSAKIRLEYLPVFSQPYFKYYARKAATPEERSLCERIYKKKEREYLSLLASNSLADIQEKAFIFDLQKKQIPFVATIVANLSKLSDEDLKLVEAQKYCPIHGLGCEPTPLGCKGVPVKIKLKGQTVFLCCKECINNAQANPEETLAELKKVKRLPFRTKKRFEQALENTFKFMDRN